MSVHEHTNKEIWNVYQNDILQEKVDGEWWITDTHTHYADGDVGEYNHEILAVSEITSEILNIFDIESYDEVSGFLNQSEYEDEIKKYLRNEYFGDLSKLSEDEYEEYQNWEYEFDLDDEIIKYVKNNELNIPDIEEKLEYAMDRKDSREYALKFLGWKRVHGNWIETWTLTESDLKQIVNGLYDIDEFFDESNQTFNIEVRSRRIVFSDIPANILSGIKIKDLMQFRGNY